MSKIGNYALALQDQANELGFSTIQEAFDNGYEDITGVLVKVDYDSEYEKAYKAWKREKEILLGDLNNLLICKAFDHDIIERAYNFIKKGAM